MRKSAALLLVLVLAASSIVAFLPVKAEAKTIVVPDDYPTISEAIRNANDGDTVFVKKGTYEGPINQTLLITKSISLIGEDPKDTIINLHPSWSLQGWNYVYPVYDYDSPMEIQANDVNISGLTISSDGGSVLAIGNRIKMRNNQITTPLLANGLHQSISDNTITKGISCYGSYNTIAGNRIVGGGIEVGGKGSSNLIYNNTVTDNYGISLVGYPVSDGNVVFNNTMKNCRIGLVVWVNGSNNVLYANNIIDNNIGLKLVNEGDNTAYYHNNLIDNEIQVLIDDQVQGTGHFDNGTEGNYWSDYMGSDGDGDGIGDTPYVIDDKRQDRYPLMAPFEVPPAPTPSPQPKEEPFPTTLVAIASIGLVAGVGAGLLVYFKKRRAKSGG